MMEDAAFYHILVRGLVEPSDLRAVSPTDLQVETANGNRTRITVYTDQSGIVGLIRQLNGLGLLMESVERQTLMREA